MSDHPDGATLGEIAAEAALERAAFVNDAGEQLARFLHANEKRIRELGGLVLIDDDPDYLSIAPDGTFRSRTRYQDEATGEWVSETEVIESPSELVELYNPAEIYAAFAEAARQEAGLAPSPDERAYGGAPEASEEGWAPVAEPAIEVPRDETEAAAALYDLALTWQERSQESEASLVERFQDVAAGLAGRLGDTLILDDDDQRLWFRANGRFEAEVVPEQDEDGPPVSGWTRLNGPEELVRFYDPTDLFGDLAETIAEQWPDVAPELAEGDRP